MLDRTIGTHPLEDYSFEMANYFNKVVSICIPSFLVLEMLFYNIYATKVIIIIIKARKELFLTIF